MKIEIISIGTELLVSDILDTNSAYISRCLRELNVTLTSKVTVGDDPDMIADVFQVALDRADVVLASGGIGFGENDFTRQAISQITDIAQIEFSNKTVGYRVLGSEAQYGQGIFVKVGEASLICLPGNRRELAYLLETEVLPYLQGQLTAVAKVSHWKLLRTVGMMESSLKQELADIAIGPNHRINFDSFAGQTNVKIWVEAETANKVEQEILRLENIILDRMGDHVFGKQKDLLEKVVVGTLSKSGYSLSIAECNTAQTISNAIKQVPQYSPAIQLIAVDKWQDLAKMLQLNQLDHDQLTQWCRYAAQALLSLHQSDLSLIVYNNVTQGGIQLLVTLASQFGVSVTQRSFGGHPENIHQWALTLGLSHLRRWLIAHESAPATLPTAPQ